jgi:hypothetical protein
MQVELVEHTLPKRTREGLEQRSLNQWLVFASYGEGSRYRVGVLGMHEGAKFLPTTVDLSPEEAKEIAEECQRMLGRRVDYQNPPSDGLGVDQLDDLDCE